MFSKLNGYRNYITTITMVLMAVMPQITEIMAQGDELSAMDFVFQMAIVVLGGLSMYFKKAGVDREVKKAIEEKA